MSNPATKMPALEERLWTAKDVADFLALSVSWVRKATARGVLPYQRIGGHTIRYDPEKIKTWAKDGTGGKVVSLKKGD